MNTVGRLGGSGAETGVERISAKMEATFCVTSAVNAEPCRVRKSVEMDCGRFAAETSEREGRGELDALLGIGMGEGVKEV